MQDIQLGNQEKQQIILKLKHYFSTELQQPLGQSEAESLMHFFSKELGAYYYNHGLYDAATMLSTKVAEISEQLQQLEKPVT